MLLDVMGTSSHAIARARLVRPDIESAYIAGAGPIGLGLLVMCKLTFGRDFPVCISDISPWRLNYAESFGARTVDASKADALAGLEPSDVAFDSTGKLAARKGALAALAKRGVLVCVGHGETLEMAVSDELIAPERAVLGSEYFRYEEMARNLELLRDNRALIARVITHRFDVAQITRGVQDLLVGRVWKSSRDPGAGRMTASRRCAGADQGGRHRRRAMGPTARAGLFRSPSLFAVRRRRPPPGAG